MASEHARRLAAASSASRLLTEASVDQTRQVDVFGLIESLGIWLAFFPLDGLLGAYLPEGAGGILVTTERSTPIQRYTAAHELGHWRLDGGHDGALDSEFDVLGRNAIERETLAQVFAGALLMPPPLVHSILSRCKATTLGPLEVYTVAREAGVSYEASARQLHHLDRITRHELRELLKVKPLKVKQAIGAGRRPVVGIADVWPVDLAWHGQQLNVHTDDEIIISLPEGRSTGYRWSIASTGPNPPRLAVERERRPAAAAQLELLPVAGGRATVVGDVYLADGAATALPDAAIRNRRAARLGASQPQGAVQHVREERATAGTAGRRVLGIRLREPGVTQFRLELRDELNEAEPADEYRLTVAVEARREGIPIGQLSDGGEGWANAVRGRQCAAAAVA